MKEGYVIRDQSLPHFLTVKIVDWVDVFSRKGYRDCVIECFEYCIKNKGMIVYSYVIMSNHIHMIVQPPIARICLTGDRADLQSVPTKKIKNYIIEV